MTLADAFAAHDAALVFGGRAGVSDLTLIESALARPYSGYHRSMPRKAAAMLQSVAGNHGFVDGNKRTGWLLTELLIDRSGYVFTFGDDEPIDDFVVSVVVHDLDFNAIVAWFAARLRPKMQEVTTSHN